MDLGIQNKVALVMASSMGLGKAVAIELATEGARVIICGNDQKSLDETFAEIQAIAPGKVTSFFCELTNEAQRKQLVEHSVKTFGDIEILVTNSGGPAAGPFEQFELDDWRRFYDLLFISVVDIIKQVLPSMKQKRAGRILAMTSFAVKEPANNLISSNAVRTSVMGLVKSLSNEVAQYDITVNNLMPGYTDTGRIQYLAEKDSTVYQMKEQIPMKRFATTREFAAAAAFLVSERASYITGQSLAVDGGWIKGN